jgi:crossover junction endodeoxyribonuclease RuvC
MMSNTVRIVGIDPGFDRLGIAIIDKIDTKETLIYSTCITTNKKDSLEKRLGDVARGLTSIFTEYTPQELSIETIFITKNQKTVIQVAEVRGVCLYIAHLFSIKVFEYSPPEIKVSITGYGKATKEDIFAMVPKILKTKLHEDKLDDEIDAIAIALTHSAGRAHKILKSL